ncbi:MAG: hypothetical protein QOI41_5991, partial [Myxococcales bacterium]|nr:hypothetical protein [Myxococcales bacterium]
ALGVDTSQFYFSEDHGALPNQATILSTTRTADVDGSSPVFTVVAIGQTAPIGMSVGPLVLAWIDDLGGFSTPWSASKKPSGAGPLTSLSGNAIRYVAADSDPISSAYWIGVGDDGTGSWAIYKAIAVTGTPTFFRAGNTDLGGLAVDNTSVYWTRPNGRVYRTLKTNSVAPPPPPQQ